MTPITLDIEKFPPMGYTVCYLGSDLRPIDCLIVGDREDPMVKAIPYCSSVEGLLDLILQTMDMYPGRMWVPYPTTFELLRSILKQHQKQLEDPVLIAETALLFGEKKETVIASVPNCIVLLDHDDSPVYHYVS